MRQKINFFLALSVLIPLPSLSQEITVQAGDTLSEIAEKQNVKLKDLIEVNELSVSRHIIPGQKLLLPSTGTDTYKTSIIKPKTHKVTAGETLITIAREYKVSKEKLIKMNNLENSNYIYVGQDIQIPFEKNFSRKIHKVEPGETLGEIAMKYKVTKMQLIEDNKIVNLNYIYPGQELYIPLAFSGNQATNEIRKKQLTNNDYHIVSAGENFSQIASLYNLPLSNLMKINSIKDPNKINVGQKILLNSSISNDVKTIYNEEIKSKSYDIATTKQHKKSDWKKYGPLKVDWTNWQTMRGSYVAPTINKEGKPLYVAINCNFRKLNSTGLGGTWRNWFSPLDKFEIDLINDVCSEKEQI